MKKTYPTILDLFSGGGGLSLGAHLAGFRTGLAIELDKKLSSSFHVNFPRSALLNLDVRRVSPSEVKSFFKGGLTGIVGGPPCQGFSTIGKRDPNDPRNSLVSEYFRLVRTLRPSFFVMENVPGILDDPFVRILESNLNELRGYEVVGPLLLDAADFGAATKRVRVFVIGYRRDYVDPLSINMFKPRRTRAVTRDAIGDLPAPTATGVARVPQNKNLSAYALDARKEPPQHLLAPEARELFENSCITGMQSTSHSQVVSDRFASISPRSRDPVSKFYRLAWDLPCPTLRAGTGPDLGSFQSARPIHPAENRVITVREAARLQGFPDWFQFHKTKWHSFRMIGNSVSPKVSEFVLAQVGKRLADF